MSDLIFQKNLQDVIKGIRLNKKDPSTFISESIADAKTETRSKDVYIKAEAIRKLTYFQFLGYDISWASFAIVEVMSQTRFAHKRIGYLAANQSFTESTDVLLLTTNLFKQNLKMTSHGNNHMQQYEIGMATSSLANIVQADLAKDCLGDVVALMSNPSSTPYVRKKAVLALYKLYTRYPQGLRLTFDALKSKLDDPDVAVVSTAVNVICELANKNPRNFLSLAPKFFTLLTTSSNNWMLIKVVKLLGSLVSEEPRLARKLLDPLVTMIKNTAAKSLQYECMHTITLALPYTTRDDGTEHKDVPRAIAICSQYLKVFIEDADANLQYLGLVGLTDLMVTSPKTVIEHRDAILRCLGEEDCTVRTRALELLAGIVTKKSVVELVNHLLLHANNSTSGSFRDDVVSNILTMCGKDKYSIISDFQWYVSVLVVLAVLPSNEGTIGTYSGRSSCLSSGHCGGEIKSKQGSLSSVNKTLISEQLIDISFRVEAVRPYAMETMLSILLSSDLILGKMKEGVYEVLKASAWVVGEYWGILTKISKDDGGTVGVKGANIEEYWFSGIGGAQMRSSWRRSVGGVLHNSLHSLHVIVMNALLCPEVITFPAHVQQVYLHSAFKVFVGSTKCCSEVDLAYIISLIRARSDLFKQSPHMEVQERMSSFVCTLETIGITLANPMSIPGQAGEHSDKNNKISSISADLLSLGTGSGKDLHPEEDLLSFSYPTPDTSLPPSNHLATLQATYPPVLGFDQRAAAIAKEKCVLLQAFTAEVFYGVHAKAQSKVSPPDNIEMSNPLNKSAFDKLMSNKHKDGGAGAVKSIQNISFLGDFQKDSKGPDFDTSSYHHQKSSSHEDVDISASRRYSSNSQGRSGVFGSALETQQKDSMYYLKDSTSAGVSVSIGNDSSSSSTQDLQAVTALSNSKSMVLSMLPTAYAPQSTGGMKHANDSVDIDTNSTQNTPSGDKTESKKERKARRKMEKLYNSGHKHSSSSAAEVTSSVDVREMLPPGANDKDLEEGSPRPRRHHHSRHKKPLAGDLETLESVDITTPLREDEVISVPRHREVPSHSTHPEGEPPDRNAEIEKGKSSKKDRKHRHSKSGVQEPKEPKVKKEKSQRKRESHSGDTEGKERRNKEHKAKSSSSLVVDNLVQL